MKTLRTLLLALFIIAGLQACAHQASPEEVTQSFWSAVVNNDLDGMREHAARDSLKNPSLLDNSEKMLSAVEVGQAQVQDGIATVETTLIGRRNEKETRLPVSTSLLFEDEQWKVNGQESINALIATSVNLMMSDMTQDLSAMGQQLSESISSGLQEFLDAFNKEAPGLKKELEKLSDGKKAQEIGQKMGTLFSRGLHDVLQEFNKGLEQLSEELDKAEKETTDSQADSKQKI